MLTPEYPWISGATSNVASIDVDEVIPREHYQAVAQIIGFVMGAGARNAADRPVASALRP